MEHVGRPSHTIIIPVPGSLRWKGLRCPNWNEEVKVEGKKVLKINIPDLVKTMESKFMTYVIPREWVRCFCDSLEPWTERSCQYTDRRLRNKQTRTTLPEQIMFALACICDSSFFFFFLSCGFIIYEFKSGYRSDQVKNVWILYEFQLLRSLHLLVSCYLMSY